MEDPFVMEIEPEVRLWLMKQREDAEVARAKRARAVCAAEHEPAHEEFTRDVKRGKE